MGGDWGSAIAPVKDDLPLQHMIKLDLIGSAYALDAFGEVMARDGAGILISSQTGYMLPQPLTNEEEYASSTSATRSL